MTTPEFRSAPRLSDQWLEDEARGDDVLKLLVAEREGLFARNADPTATQDSRKEDRMREVGAKITARKAKLDEFEVRANGNPMLFDLYIRDSDAQEAVENNSDRDLVPQLRAEWDEARAALRDYQDWVDRDQFTEDT